MAAGALGYPQKNSVDLPNHGVHDYGLVRLLAWSAEHGLGINIKVSKVKINMNK